MAYLLDTQIAVWAVEGVAGEMGARALSVVREPGNSLHVSIASLWELTVKSALGKFQMPGGTIRAFTAKLLGSGISLLAVQTEHLVQLERLPQLHKDPFDRLIIAQSRAERLRLVSADTVMRFYDPDVIR